MVKSQSGWDSFNSYQGPILLNLSSKLQNAYPSVDWHSYIPILFKHLQRSVITSDVTLTVHFLQWVRNMLKHRYKDNEVYPLVLKLIEDEIAEHSDDSQFDSIKHVLKQSARQAEKSGDRETGSTRLDLTMKHGNLARLYFDFLLAGDRNAATLLIKDWIEDGIPIQDIYLKILQPCMEEVGRLWELNQLSIAQEHYISASTQMIMALTYPYIFNTERNGKKLAAAAIADNLHELGTRMVTDLFELKGWDTLYLGGNLPTDSLVSEVIRWEPDVLAVSISLGSQLDETEKLIHELRQQNKNPEVKILVGGRVFIDHPALTLSPEPDYYAKNLESGINWANSLTF